MSQRIVDHFNQSAQTALASGESLADDILRASEAMLDTLIQYHALGQATDVLLAGGSAGGLSTYLHADRVAEYLRGKGAPLKRFKAAPVSWLPANDRNVSFCSRPSSGGMGTKGRKHEQPHFRN